MLYGSMVSRVLVIGATSGIARKFIAKLDDFGVPKKHKVVSYSRKSDDSNRFDFSKDDPKKVFSDMTSEDVCFIFASIANPNIVFQNPDLAWDINVIKTIRLIDFIVSRGASIIFLSSVEVFDGLNAPYDENSSTNALNYYGKTKVAIEEHLMSCLNYSNYLIIRLPWNISDTLETRCLVTNTYGLLLQSDYSAAVDYFSSAISIDDTARFLSLLIELDLKKIPKILHLSNPKYFDRISLVNFIVRESQLGAEMRFHPVKFAELPLIEARAKDTRLDASRVGKLFNFEYSDLWQAIKSKVQLLDVEHLRK
jgi:dTDP-4-dehydrorhamnose reductase